MFGFEVLRHVFSGRPLSENNSSVAMIKVLFFCGLFCMNLLEHSISFVNRAAAEVRQA